MERKPALVTGIAVAGVAAVVAATPAIFSPPSMQEVRVTASAPAPLLKKQVTVTDIQLAAFTLQGLVSAYMDGYYDPTYRPDVEAWIVSSTASEIAAQEVKNGPAVDLTPAEKAAIRAGIESRYAVSSEAGAIYYTLDQLLPAGINIDDDYFVYDVPGVYIGLLTSVGIPEEVAGAVVEFITNPVGMTLDFAEALGLPPVISDLINDPIITVFAIARDLATGKIPDSFFGNGLLQEVTAPSGDAPSGITSLTSGADTFTVNTVSGSEEPGAKLAKLAEPVVKPAEPEVKPAEPEVKPDVEVSEVKPEVKLPKFDFDAEKVKGPRAIAGFLKKQKKQQEAEKDSSNGVTGGGAAGGEGDNTSGGAEGDNTSGGVEGGNASGGAEGGNASGGAEGGNASGGGE